MVAKWLMEENDRLCGAEASGAHASPYGVSGDRFRRLSVQVASSLVELLVKPCEEIIILRFWLGIGSWIWLSGMIG